MHLHRRRDRSGTDPPQIGSQSTAWSRVDSAWCDSRAAALGDELPTRILAAIRHFPHLLGGTDRFDTVLLQETNGAVFSKVGAEGVHSVMVPEAGLGIALKVEDGALRAQHCAVLQILVRLNVLQDPLPPRLAEWMVKPIRNTRGEIVGEVRPAE